MFIRRISFRKSCNENNSSTHQNITIENIAQEIKFETTIPAAQFVRLPRDAQIQIDAALNSLEAMDYRDWVCYLIFLNYFIH